MISKAERGVKSVKVEKEGGDREGKYGLYGMQTAKSRGGLSGEPWVEP